MKPKTEQAGNSTLRYFGSTRSKQKRLGNRQLRRKAKLILNSEDPDALVIECVAPGYWS